MIAIMNSLPMNEGAADEVSSASTAAGATSRDFRASFRWKS